MNTVAKYVPLVLPSPLVSHAAPPAGQHSQVEDEPILRAIPYIGDDDPDGFLDDLAKEYEHHPVCIF